MSNVMTESTFLVTNARLVLADHVIERGWVAAVDGRIAEIGEGNAPERGDDAHGDIVMPGLVELHTDHIEAHYVPRPKVFWDATAAVVSYDGQLATCGITTVLDSLRVWREDGAEEVDGRAGVLAAAISSAREHDLLRADHFLHLRCEIPMPSVVEEAKELVGRPDVRLMSLMDHTPGQRQFRNEEKLRDYYRGKNGGKTDAELDVMFARRLAYQQAHAATNTREIVALAHEQVGVPDRAEPRLPAAVGDYPLVNAVAGADHELGQELRGGAVVRAGPLGVEAHEPAVPPVGEQRAEHVLALAQ